MKKNADRSPKIKALNTLCASVLLGSLIYILVSGVHMAALAMVVTSAVGLATPVVLSGEGFMDIITGLFEAVFEGIAVIFEGIADFISGIFS